MTAAGRGITAALSGHQTARTVANESEIRVTFSLTVRFFRQHGALECDGVPLVRCRRTLARRFTSTRRDVASRYRPAPMRSRRTRRMHYGSSQLDSRDRAALRPWQQGRRQLRRRNDVALRAGFLPPEIVFTASAIPRRLRSHRPWRQDDQAEQGRSRTVARCFASAVARRSPSASIRISTRAAIPISTASRPTIRRLVDEARDLPAHARSVRIEIVGLHTHCRSQIMDLERSGARLAQSRLAKRSSLRVGFDRALDLGGGLGISYDARWRRRHRITPTPCCRSRLLFLSSFLTGPQLAGRRARCSHGRRRQGAARRQLFVILDAGRTELIGRCSITPTIVRAVETREGPESLHSVGPLCEARRWERPAAPSTRVRRPFRCPRCWAYDR